MDWQLVYDLKLDTDFVTAVQKATLTTDEFGIEPTNGLFGSAEWWRQVESGDLPLHTLKGIVTRVFMGSMGDWPEFEMQTDDGSLFSFRAIRPHQTAALITFMPLASQLRWILSGSCRDETPRIGGCLTSSDQ